MTYGSKLNDVIIIFYMSEDDGITLLLWLDKFVIRNIKNSPKLLVAFAEINYCIIGKNGTDVTTWQ